mmetsp:Transcript_10504/g.18942  ORF Transcript_10504/g.18942 Transcript_10504/m.18942 type:complete len:192 (-) Transcript_10504:1434-2009(-)
MVLVLTIGDLDVPFGSPGLPEKFQKMLVPGKIQYVLVTGNSNTRHTEQFFSTLGAEVHTTKGEFDIMNHPDRIVISVGSVSFGLTHGHQIIPWGDIDAAGSLKRDMGVDVLVCGFSHELQIHQPEDGGLIVNPGSATGAPCIVSGKSNVTPSFVLMDVMGSRIVAYTYTLVDDVRSLDIPEVELLVENAII